MMEERVPMQISVGPNHWLTLSHKIVSHKQYQMLEGTAHL